MKPLSTLVLPTCGFWVAIELKSREILALPFCQKYPKKETCSLLRDLFQALLKFMENHPVSTDG